ncbi:hypothetical protein [Galbibacter sp. BG1]
MIYNTLLKIKVPTTIPKLKENIMTNREAIMHIISTANKEMGSPKMTACFRMFL